LKRRLFFFYKKVVKISDKLVDEGCARARM